MQAMIRFFEPFRNKILKRNAYWITLIITTLICYGESILSYNMNVDDPAYAFYFTQEKNLIAGYRWGEVLMASVFGVLDFSPYLSQLLAVFFIVLGSVAFSWLMFIVWKEENILPYIVIACSYVSFPLISEIWAYSMANWVYGICLLLAVISIIIMYTLESGKQAIILSGVILSLVASSYECGLFAYVTIVLIILFCKLVFANESKETLTSLLSSGTRFAIPLLIAIAIRITIGKIVMSAMHIEYVKNGASSIYFGITGPIRGFILSVAEYYVKGLVYRPLFFFLVNSVVFVSFCICVSIKRKSWLPLINGLAIICSLFLLSYLQAMQMPYRTAMPILVFNSFVMGMVCKLAVRDMRKGCNHLLVVILCYCIYIQCVDLSNAISMNLQKARNEAHILQNIGMELQSDYSNREIVFCGEYQIGNHYSSIQTVPDYGTGKLVRKILSNEFLADKVGYGLMQSNVRSVLNWAMCSYDTQRNMKNLFEYYGYDILVRDDYSVDDYNNMNMMAEKLQLNDFEIIDLGEYVLVHI